MSEGRQRGRFLAFLQRLRSGRGVNQADEEGIRSLAVSGRERMEREPRRDGGPQNIRDFYKTGVPKFKSREAGLKSFGWKEVSEERADHASGAYARIRLAYRRKERGVPLERRHLCAAKVQPLESFTVAWNEVEILRAVVHENIVDIYGLFTVEPVPPNPNPDRQMELSYIWILLEYANAGDLRKEMSRFEGNRIPELGAKYYVRQIADGTAYLHSKYILHCDLHPKNVLLKYNPDATKTCMICDFGSSLIIHPNDSEGRFQRDVARICQLAVVITGNFWRQGDASDEADEVFEIGRLMSNHKPESAPQTVSDLFTLSWFMTPGVPPIPRPPTPMLDDVTVTRIGFLPQTDPTGVPAASRTRSPPHEPTTALAGSRAPIRGSIGQRIAGRVRSIGSTISRSFTRSWTHRRHE